jgi:hypothetical protein
MKKLVIITKKPLMFFISLIAVIGFILSCADELYNPGILPPAIAEIGPDAAFEGAEVVIYGANFSSATAKNAVSFNGIDATVTATKTSEITTIVPMGATTGEVTVATNNLTSAGYPFTVKIPIIATITSLEPDSAEIGDTVTITGTNFSTTPEDNVVSFAGGIATVIASTETTITTTVPATASTGDVTVTRDQASNGLEFTVTTPIFYVTVQITDDTDDAEEGANNGAMTNTSSDLELGEYDTWTQDGVEQGLQTIGLRFNDIEIPAGSKILAASIQFTADNTGSDPVQLTIFGEANSNPITFTNDDDLLPYDITSRARTVANAVWDVPPWPDSGDAGPDQETVDFASIIQELIDRADWASGNSMAIIMDHSGPSIGVTSSSGGREAEAGPGSDAPTLKIIYQ